jgi:preprotein translocase SecE subunit
MNRQHRRQLSGRGQDSSGPLPDDAEARVEEHLATASTAGGSGVETDEGAARIARDALAPSRHRVGPRQFLHEVNTEMRKVAWPSRAETVNYSTVVFITLALLMALIFGLDVVFTKFAGFLFNP